MQNLWKQLLDASKNGLFFIAGPNVIESQEHSLRIASHIAQIQQRLNVPIVFKASFDKAREANRTSSHSFRGPGMLYGMTEGLRILETVKQNTGLPIITDIHEQCQAEPVASVADIVQIPAFLCRQTDLLLAAGRTGRIIHIKKGQFASPTAMREQALKIVEGTGNGMVMLCERGTTFGYEDLVVDPRSLVRMARDTGLPVVMDVTHALQRPSTRTGSEGGVVSGGDGSLVRELGDVAAACGVSGIFVEVHEDPSRARCDAQVQTPLARLEQLLVRWSYMARSQRSAPPA